MVAFEAAISANECLEGGYDPRYLRVLVALVPQLWFCDEIYGMCSATDRGSLWFGEEAAKLTIQLNHKCSLWA